MLRRIALACALATLLVCQAFAADTILDSDWSYAGVTQWTLCDDQTSGTTCVTGSDTNIISAPRVWLFRACGDSSDQATGWTADIYGKTYGAGSGSVRETITVLGSLTPSNPCVYWSGGGGDYHGVLGGTLTSGVTIVVTGWELIPEVNQ